jgi:hypothetical protein
MASAKSDLAFITAFQKKAMAYLELVFEIQDEMDLGPRERRAANPDYTEEEAQEILLRV